MDIPVDLEAFKATLGDLIPGAKVLNLRSGASDLSKSLLSSGADSVIDQDGFEIGKATEPTAYEGAPFDIVVSLAVLVDTTKSDVAAFFQDVKVNLNKGGIFVGLVDDLKKVDAFGKAAMQSGFTAIPGWGGMKGQIVGTVSSTTTTVKDLGNNWGVMGMVNVIDL